jgi:hypothetical protein
MLLTRVRKRINKQERKNTFWLYTLGELVLVVLGILIALQIENWNQERQDRKLEKILLNEMLVNLRSDLRDANSNYTYNEDFKRSNEIVLSYLDGQFPYDDSLEYHFGHLNGGTVFDENTSTYESLKSIGIDLIRTDSLRRKITYLYEARYDYIRTIAEAAYQNNNMHLVPAIRDHLYVEIPLEKARPLDPTAIRESSSFRLAILNNIMILEYQQHSYSLAIRLMEELMNNIELELETRK